jgi:adenine phosphoribosyltransferase
MKGDYPYFINPISDGNPPITKDLLDEITDLVVENVDLDCDMFLAPEAMGIQYATALTIRTGIPFQVIRKRGFGLPGELSFQQRTGYGNSTMFLNYVQKGAKAILIDDVISTGGTLVATVKALREGGIQVDKAIIILNKAKDIDAIAKEAGIEIYTLLDVAVTDGKPVLR